MSMVRYGSWIAAVVVSGSILVRPGGGDVAVGRHGLALAHVAEHELPAGPIRERHELMEDMGKQAKALNGALQAGNTAGVAAPAEAIARLAAGIVKLFPPGSTDLALAKRSHATITELARFPADLRDGPCALQLQLPAFSGDAVPSRPLYLPLVSR